MENSTVIATIPHIRIQQLPDPAEHAIVLLDVWGGDLLKAWTMALDLAHLAARKNDIQERDYFVEVADIVARQRPTHLSAEFYRNDKFLSH